MEVSETKLHIRGLTERVRAQFISQAEDLRALNAASAHAHLSRVRRSGFMRSMCFGTACSFCLTQESSYILECKHGLCSTCVLKHGEENAPWHYTLANCLVCCGPTESIFALKPPTAGMRLLTLGGSNAANLLHFLRNLQQLIGLNSMPLRDHFDGVSGSDMGMSLPNVAQFFADHPFQAYTLSSLPLPTDGASQIAHIISTVLRACVLGGIL